MNIEQASPEQLRQLSTELEAQYADLASMKLNLDLTRGKPGTAQVALSAALDGSLAGDYCDTDGLDVRNYGGAAGIASARALFGEMLGFTADNTLVGGNSSLSLMYEVVNCALNFGLSAAPWRDKGPAKMLCPVPGYDRHYTVCEHLGIEMISVPMGDSGPDMDQVEALLRHDPSIRGMWCVPRFSNPTGVVYDADTVARIAQLGNLAEPGFLVLWDNAYSVHAFSDKAPQLPDLAAACRLNKTEDSAIHFGSTSKITFAGAGVAFLAGSHNNLAALSRHLGAFTIGPDKVNQLRQVRFLKDANTIAQLMKKHAAIIKPRFDAVETQLQAGLEGTGLGQWTQPSGGYFVSFQAPDNTAAAIVKLAADIGVKLTPAGATFPYGKDPRDNTIRIAPTFPALEELNTAMMAFVLCVKLASVRQRLQHPA